jgi:hypothetical protein
VTNTVTYGVTDGVSHTTPSRPVPTRPVTTNPYCPTDNTTDQGSTSYAAYLDSMLAHLRRVHRGQVLRYYGIDA